MDVDVWLWRGCLASDFTMFLRASRGVVVRGGHLLQGATGLNERFLGRGGCGGRLLDWCI